MKHLCKLSLFIFLPFFTLAQSNYKPGYIVTTKGDTIHGFIDFRDWGQNPRSISFKTTVTSSVKKAYDIGTISFFSVDGLVLYKKYVCAISLDATEAARIAEGRDTTFKVDTVFLKIIQQGKKVALYSYTDDIKTRFYIGEAPEYAPTELVYHIYYGPGALGNRTTIVDNGYQKQLFSLASKYNVLDDRLSNTLQKTDYNSGDLLDVVTRINNMSKADLSKQNTGSHSTLVFYAGATANIVTTSSYSGSYYTAGGGTGSTSTSPGATVGINFVPSSVSDQVEFRGELALIPGQFNSNYTLKVSPYTAARASYDQTMLCISPQVILNVYNTPSYKFFLGTGVTFMHSSFSNVYFDDPKATNPGNFPEESYAFNSTDISFIFEAGFRIQSQFEVTARYYTSYYPQSEQYFSLSTHIIQIGVSYLFGKTQQ